MTLKTNMKHPNFILGLISYILFLIGIIMVSTGYEVGKAVVFAAVIMGALQWVGSLVDVSRDPALNDQHSRYFWFAIVLMIPPLAGMLYYMVDAKRITD